MGKKGLKWYREMLLHPKWFLLRTKIWERENHSCEKEGVGPHIGRVSIEPIA